MSASEVTVITNPSGSPDWFEIADAGHDVVQFSNSGGEATQIGLGDTAPSVGIALGNIVGIVCVKHANAKVWCRIKASSSITVMRGDAVLKVL